MNQTTYEKLAAKMAPGLPAFHDFDDVIENEEAGEIVTTEADNHRNAPVPDPACLHGVVGLIANEAARANSEVNPYAAALATITMLACGFGRGAYLTIGDDWHHPRIFGLHVGRSGRGRKGTASKLVTRILRDLDERHPDVAFKTHTGGLSSREGLVCMIHDGYKTGKTETPPIDDKRLLVIESEFANVLHQASRDGNTLSSALRDSWDGTSIKPATKTSQVWASHPHINLLGHITPGELKDLMRTRELTNGFANRLLTIWAEQPALDPDPSYTPNDTLHALTDRVADVLRFAQADRWVDRDQMRVTLSDEARTMYRKLYKTQLQDNRAGELVAGLLTRRAPYLLRLAMVFALCDKTVTIEKPHLLAALAWVNYWADSIKFIFASADDELVTERTTNAAEEVLGYLAKHAEATRTDLIVKCFQKHITKTVLDSALDQLLQSAPPRIVVTDQPRKDRAGSGKKIYSLANCANSAKSVSNQQIKPDFDSCEVCELCEVWSDDDGKGQPQFAQFAEFATVDKQPQTRMDIDNSHNSQSSQRLSEKSIEQVVI